jgi:hypothetical protein
MPGNPWPHDMVIRIQDDPHALVDLLFVREAWRLAPLGDDLPPELDLVVPRLTGVDEDTRAAWSAQWPDVWRAALTHAGRERDPMAFERLRTLPPGSPERERVLDEMFGPTARDAFGDEAFPDAFDTWKSAWTEAVVARVHRPRPLDEEPERICLDALVPAWRAGLTTVIELPVADDFTRRVGANALAVSSATRADPTRYRAALAAFA